MNEIDQLKKMFDRAKIRYDETQTTPIVYPQVLWVNTNQADIHLIFAFDLDGKFTCFQTVKTISHKIDPSIDYEIPEDFDPDYLLN